MNVSEASGVRFVELAAFSETVHANDSMLKQQPVKIAGVTNVPVLHLVCGPFAYDLTMQKSCCYHV